MTAISQLRDVIEFCDVRVGTSSDGDAKANLTLAKRHAEDAIMRINRAMALEAGTATFADLTA